MSAGVMAVFLFVKCGEQFLVIQDTFDVQAMLAAGPKV
jgi:hypothetical protein